MLDNVTHLDDEVLRLSFLVLESQSRKGSLATSRDSLGSGKPLPNLCSESKRATL